jgi:hypothetical protein
VGFLDLLRRDAGIAALEQGDDVGFPGEVDDLLMREDGIGMCGLRRNEEKQNEREGKKAATARLVIRGRFQHIRLISMHSVGFDAR